MPTVPTSKDMEKAADMRADDDAADNWAHRSAGMKCRTCMWYVPKRGRIGRCRRNAPTMGGFPVTFDSDWCGQHKLNEEDIG